MFKLWVDRTGAVQTLSCGEKQGRRPRYASGYDMTLEDIAATPAPAPKPKVELKREVRRCRYLTWEGSRKHPKAVEHFEECEIVGDWAMTSNGKKSTKANGFYFCR